MSSDWYKEEEGNKVWWLDNGEEVKGVMIFSFDRKKKYNLFLDYPHNLSKKEVEIFNEEYPFWADFFEGR